MSSETVYSWVLLSGYFLAVAAIAVASRGRSFEAFSVGARNLHPAFVGLSVAAASTSTATFVINPGLVYLYGWSGFVAIYFASGLGFLVGLVVFSKSFRRLGDRFSALTLPQWIGEREEKPWKAPSIPGMTWRRHSNFGRIGLRIVCVWLGGRNIACHRNEQVALTHATT